MALDLNLGTVIKTNLASRFKKFVSTAGRGGALNIPDLSDFGKISATQRGAGQFQNFSFPLDVTASSGDGGNQGHYMMFLVNEQVGARIKYGGGDMTGQASSLKKTAAKSGLSPEQVSTHINESTANLSPSEIAYRAAAAQKRSSIISQNLGKKSVVTRAPVRKSVAAVSMFMPAQVATTYGANYTDTGIGMFVGDALNIYDELRNKGLDANIGAAGSAIADGVGNLATLALQKSLGSGVVPGLSGLQEARGITTGEIISERMELAFKGINKRQFQYTFKMIPKSAAEADEIKNIIHLFKRNMLPEMTGGDATGRRMTIPNTFNIQYMYNGADNNFLHKIGECVLENFSVSYGGEKYATYNPTANGAPPVETTITLAFKELDLVTRAGVEAEGM
jgi:hypothetical protein